MHGKVAGASFGGARRSKFSKPLSWVYSGTDGDDRRAVGALSSGHGRWELSVVIGRVGPAYGLGKAELSGLFALEVACAFHRAVSIRAGM